MKSIKKIVILSLLLLTVVGCGAVPTLKNGEQKVASIKNGGISADALYEKMKTKYGAQEFIDLVDTEILNKKYKETEAEKENIKSQIDELKKSAKENNVTFEQILAYYGFENEKSLKDYLRLSYRRDQAVNDYISKLLSDKEIKSYYDKEIYGDIKAKHILISPNTTDDMSTEEKEAAENKAKKQAEDIIKKLDNKEDFSKLAKKYSDDTATAKKGGDLGWFSTGDMVAEFDEAAFKLKKGTYTKTPVKTTYGYHIIYKVDEKKKPTLEDSKKTIVDTLVKKKKEEDGSLYYTALDKIRKNAGLKFEDDELKKAYTKCVQNQKSQAKSSAQ